MDRSDERARDIVIAVKTASLPEAIVSQMLRQVREDTIIECAGVARKRAATLGIASSHLGQSRVYEAETCARTIEALIEEKK